MDDNLREQLAEVRDRYPGLRLKPGRPGFAHLEGLLAFRVAEGQYTGLQGTFLLKIAVPRDYPRTPPVVWELRGEIPRDVHVNPDETLCLASPIDLQMALLERPSLLEFLERFLLAFLVGFVVFKKKGRFPYGERDHGQRGVLQGIADWLACRSALEAVVPCLRVFLPGYMPGPGAACPCGSAESFAQCHEARFSELAGRYGRQEMCEVAWRQLQLLGFPSGSQELAFPKWQREAISELLTDCRQLLRTPAPNVHFGRFEAGGDCRLPPTSLRRQGY